MKTKSLPRGFFVTFEGGEGAGKSTLIGALKESLQSQGLEVLCTREPGGCSLAEEVRRWVLQLEGSVATRAEILLFLAARAQHVEELIRPALSEGKVVLCDRFSDSTVAYQGAARGLGVTQAQDLCAFATGGLKPDLTLYLDITPEVGLERSRRVAKDMAKANEVDRMEAETLDFHRTVRKAYLELAEQQPSRIKVLDGSGSPEEVLRQATEWMDKEIKALS